MLLPGLSLHHHKCICSLFLKGGGPPWSPGVRNSTEEPLYDFWSQPWKWHSFCLTFSQDAHSWTQWSSLWNMEILTHLERNRPQLPAQWSSRFRAPIASHGIEPFFNMYSPILFWVIPTEIIGAKMSKLFGARFSYWALPKFQLYEQNQSLLWS